MAREIHEREDLLRDARALVPRAMLRVELDGVTTDVFAGYRGESLSIYFGDDPVLHFNRRGELRRAFLDGRLLKADQGRLASLERRSSEAEAVLSRVDLDATQQRAWLQDAASLLDDLRAALAAGRWRLIGQMPEDGDAVARLQAWLDGRAEVVVARSPRVGD